MLPDTQHTSTTTGHVCDGIPAVSLRGVAFSYGDSPVLESVDLSVCAGEFISVIGPNGGGKTTLLRLMLGQLSPQAGTVRIFGEPPVSQRMHMGYTPQHSTFDRMFPVTVLDVVLMGRLRAGHYLRYSREDRDAAMRALEEVELADVARRSFHALSGGQRQRVLIARAIAGAPKLLLLDEPTANVDVLAGNHLLELLQRLNARMTVILVSHDLGFVASMVSSVICVNRQVAYHPTSELTGDAVAELYGGEFRMIRHDHRCSVEGHHHA